jgi:archaellum component FlaG (FlaF/FlaG flagellin family)
MKQRLVITILIIVAGLTAACSTAATQLEMIRSQSGASSLFTTQSNSEQAVTVAVTPLNLPNGGSTLNFEVAFNTHSVDLSFDPAAISVLRDGAGREYPAVAWEGAGPGGHHRSGVLRFKVPDDTTDFIEVVIHEVAGVPERVFHWNLK